MSTTHYEINIHIDGRTMTPVKMYQFAMGLMAGNNEERPPNLHHEFILAKRQIRKLERKLRKAAGREKRLLKQVSFFEGRMVVLLNHRATAWRPVDHAQCKCVVENVNL